MSVRPRYAHIQSPNIPQQLFWLVSCDAAPPTAPQININFDSSIIAIDRLPACLPTCLPSSLPA